MHRRLKAHAMSLMSYGRHTLNSVAILCNSFHLTSNGTPTEVVSGHLHGLKLRYLRLALPY